VASSTKTAQCYLSNWKLTMSNEPSERLGRNCRQVWALWVALRRFTHASRVDPGANGTSPTVFERIRRVPRPCDGAFTPVTRPPAASD
jgi:hypothetical protein